MIQKTSKVAASFSPLKHLLLSCAVITASACAPPSPADELVDGEESRPLIGGREAQPAELPAAVQLRNALCSGVVISPRHILTAGHCVERESGKDLVQDDELQIVSFLGRDVGNSWYFAEVGIASRHAHPTWHDRLAKLKDPDAVADLPDTSDLGIYTLKTDLPIAPATLAQVPPSVARNAVLMSGSGCQSPGGPALNVPKLGEVDLQDVEPGRLQVGPLFKGSPTAAPVVGCSGDSGGAGYLLDHTGVPALDANGGMIVAGITSTTLPLPDGSTEPATSVLARVDHLAAAQWIKEVLAKDARPPRPVFAFNKVHVEIETLVSVEELRAKNPNDKIAIATALGSDRDLAPILDDALLAALTDALMDPSNNGRIAHELIDEILRTEAKMHPMLWQLMESIRRAVMHPSTRRSRLVFYLKRDTRFAQLAKPDLERIADTLIKELDKTVPAILAAATP